MTMVSPEHPENSKSGRGPHYNLDVMGLTDSKTERRVVLPYNQKHPYLSQSCYVLSRKAGELLGLLPSTERIPNWKDGKRQR